MTATATAPAPPAPTAALSRTTTNVVFGTILLGLLMSALDQTIVSTALPTIVADLGDAGHMAWVVTAYLLAEVVSTALAGKFGDLFGRKVVFQVSGGVFLLGSVIAGAAPNMAVLIVGRAIQGIGGGGLMVTAMALIADVIPLRERGRYQGALGAVFGVSTVVGPTLGGLLTDRLSWHWCFYVNVPIGVVMIVIAARTIPAARSRTRPAVDYAGVALVALGACALVLALEWGGQAYPWSSPLIVGLLVATVVLLTGFVLVERRAAEPILPLGLFRQRVFVVCAVLSFVVGFAMLGALTYLPTYLQYVDGSSATSSGVRTLPLVVGLFATSTLSGSVVSRTGRYKVFPIVGTAVMAVGLFLMSTMDAGTGVVLESLYMLVLGVGLGCSMQVLTIAVQNTVPYAQLGTATSGVTFFRTIGSAFGTAVFGSLYNSELGPRLGEAVAASGVPETVATSAAALRALPAAQAAPVVTAYADAITFVFAWVVPVALVGFAVAWFLPEVPLRDTVRSAATDVGDGFSAPDSSDRRARLERAVARLMRRFRDDAAVRREVLADSRTGATVGQVWALGQVHWRDRRGEPATLDSVARAHHLPAEVLEPAFDDLVRAGYLERSGDALALTPAGRALTDAAHAAWRRWLTAQLADWHVAGAEDRALLDQALDDIARTLQDEDHAPRRTAVPA